MSENDAELTLQYSRKVFGFIKEKLFTILQENNYNDSDTSKLLEILDLNDFTRSILQEQTDKLKEKKMVIIEEEVQNDISKAEKIILSLNDEYENLVLF
ncbi:MAG: hypothetical protein MHPSP_000248 [Paramarteilia canceri]